LFLFRFRNTNTAMSSIISNVLTAWNSLTTPVQLSLGLGGLGVLVFYYIFKGRSIPQADKRIVALKPSVANPKKDVVYLFQFPPVAKFNASPFCLKVETYLKLNKIPYEVVKGNHMSKSPKGKLPIIELNGEVITDSGFIIDRLKLKFGDPDSDLSPQQRAISTLLQRTWEDHLNPIFLYYRWIHHEGWSYWGDKGLASVPAPIKLFLVPVIRKGIWQNIWGQGIGRFSEEEMVVLAKQDIAALEGLLSSGNNKFIFGEKPHTVDVQAYSLLYQIFLSSIQSTLAKQIGIDSFPAVKSYAGRMKQLVEGL